MSSYKNPRVKVQISGSLVALIKKQVTVKMAGFEFDSFGPSKYKSFTGTGCLGENISSLNQVWDFWRMYQAPRVGNIEHAWQHTCDRLEDYNEGYNVKSPQELPGDLERNGRVCISPTWV